MPVTPKSALPPASAATSNGRPAGSRGQIAHVQRARVLSATAALAVEQGVAATSVTAIVRRAGVSRRTFYELFTSAEDSVVAAAEDALALLHARVEQAYDPAAPWHVRIRAGLVELLRFLDQEPLAGRLLVVESLGAGPAAIRRREQWLAPLYTAVDAGRAEHARGQELPRFTAQGVVGGALSIIHTRMLPRSEAAPLVELASPLMSMIALPYLGAAAARRELSRPAPTPAPDRPQSAMVADHIAQLPMRLTYRTIRVIRAVAAEPSASNRRVGALAGIADQGQVSKLLRRLERLGLASNGGGPPANGTPNAWTLTPAGLQLEQATHGSPGSQS